MAVATIITAIFNLVYSRLQQTRSPFPGTSSVVLSSSIIATMQKHSHLPAITFWRITFHASFGIAILFNVSLVLQGQLVCTVSSLF